MTILTDKTENRITREQIDEIFERAAMEELTDIHNQFLSCLEQVPEEWKDNPPMREVLAAHIAQINALVAMKRILCELFGIEGTTSATQDRENRVQ